MNKGKTINMNKQANVNGMANMSNPLKNTSDYKCEECGNLFFENKIIIKKKSGLLTPSGKDEIIPINVPVCSSCGKVPPIISELKGVISDELVAKDTDK